MKSQMLISIEAEDRGSWGVGSVTRRFIKYTFLFSVIALLAWIAAVTLFPSHQKIMARMMSGGDPFGVLIFVMVVSFVLAWRKR